MIELLQTIVDWFVCWVKTGIMLFVNFAIEGLGTIIAGFVALLPDMPELPSMPAWFVQGFAWGQYYFPLDFLLTALTLFVTLWAAWFVLAIPLRWAKATDE